MAQAADEELKQLRDAIVDALMLPSRRCVRCTILSRNASRIAFSLRIRPTAAAQGLQVAPKVAAVLFVVGLEAWGGRQLHSVHAPSLSILIRR